MARPSRVEAAAIAERRSTAISLRLAGADPLTIGRKLYADPEHNSDQIAYPMGYGIERYREGKPPLSDKKLIIRVCQDIGEALKKRNATLTNTAAELRELENARLDQYQMIAHRHAIGGGPDKAAPDPVWMDRALKIMDRRARLNGLDAPTEISGKGGDPIIVEIDPGLIPGRMDAAEA